MYEIGSGWDDNSDPIALQRQVLDSSMDAFGVGMIADFVNDLPGFSDFFNGLRDADGVEGVGEVVEQIATFLRGIASIFEQLRDAITQNVIPAAGTALREIYDFMKDSVTGGINNLQATLNQIRDLFNGLVVTPINNVVSGVKDWLYDLLNWKTTTTTNHDAIRDGIIKGWEGTASVSADDDVWGTMDAIRSRVGNEGYTRVGITSTQLWTKPSGTTEIVLVGIAAGKDGEPGGNDGGLGGLGGGHKVQAIDPASVSAVHVTVGTNGQATQFRADSSGGALLMEALSGSPGGLGTLFGYSSSNSSAGSGGAGGAGFRSNANGIGTDTYAGSNGADGSMSAAAVGGDRGAYRAGDHGLPGGSGESVASASVIPCGGGGGGGGGGAGKHPTAMANGGTGGDGGFPGGGGGGGGGRQRAQAFGVDVTVGAQGPGGLGGQGLGLIFYR
ncbi:hypothetical protein HUN08_12665 [Gordonia sp. X0973]|uniref:hypothetical protein n=1 Tax=Gordonia sp. X0973 TaxID=2742602 RepID=UPI0013EA2621|nr:hypothetical protein [Gordonia sp. X0973]QKT07945.1 hypothetical protein HUN08_12665 [Gordonia sp. X0973]